MTMLWLEFTISAAIIVFAGTRLTRYADELSDRLGLGKVWIGVALLGVVTSLPEAAASLTAVVHLHADDLAVGNILGSNVFNPMILVLMDIFYGRASVTDAVSPNASHRFSAALAVLLMSVVLADICVGQAHRLAAVGPLSFGSFLILPVYCWGMYRLSTMGRGGMSILEGAPRIIDRKISLTKIWINLVFSAILVVSAAVWLADVCDRIAAVTGWGQTFVGSLFLAVATSLPEMVVSFAAVKFGALDLAIGNIFGSNMANIFILFVCGLVHPMRPLLYAVSPTHVVTGVLGIVLTLLALAAIHLKGKKTFLRLGWDTFLMTAIFVVGMRIVYQLR